jgi:UDP-glucose 4-epimerase
MAEFRDVVFTICRFFNVYGPRQDPRSAYNGVMSVFMQRCKEAKNIMVFGDEEQTRDFVYVGDLVNAIQALIAK